MEPQNREGLAKQWEQNEAEIERLADLPVGAADPAAREAELDAQQDAIEGLLGEQFMERRRKTELAPEIRGDMERFLGALSRVVGREVTGDQLAGALRDLRKSGERIDLRKQKNLDAIVRVLRDRM